PLALLVDDVHWADELSLRFLNYLADRLDDLAVALVVAIRTGDPSAETDLVAQLSATSADRLVRPPALTEPAVRDFLAASGVAVSAELAGACWKATAGNPFLLQELVATMRADERNWLGADLDDLAAFAPRSVRKRVVLRLRRLGQDAQELAGV